MIRIAATFLLLLALLCSCDRPADVKPGECWVNSWTGEWECEPLP